MVGLGTYRPGKGVWLASSRRLRNVIYVLRGALKMESGPTGNATVEAGPGDFVYVPKGVVHRESNPSNEPAEIIVVRAGVGESTFNVDGPAPV
jgi:uncharacterized RmlC-like cupin family protein